MSDEKTPAGEGGAVSLRVVREADGRRSWRAHVPGALITAAILAVGQLGGCQKLDEQGRKLDDVRDRVARIEGAMGLGPRLAARVSGAEGAGGTAATPGL